MDITYLGHSSFKIKTKLASVVTDPFDSKIAGLKNSSIDGEIVTISHAHPDHDSVGRVEGVKKVINGPGEYEIAGVSVMGYQTFHDNKKGEERGKNTIYIYEVEGLRLAHLGDLGHALSDSLLDEIGDIDILMIPVGGVYTIGPKEAMEIISKIEPSYVLPMHYKVDDIFKELNSEMLPVTDFLKESGLSVENLPKFSIKKDEILEDQNTKVIVLERK